MIQYLICFALCFVVEKPVWKLVLQLYPCLVDCTTSPSPSVCKALRDALHEYADLLSPPTTVITNGTTWPLIKSPGTKSNQARSLELGWSYPCRGGRVLSCDSHVTIQEDSHVFCDGMRTWSRLWLIKEERLDQVFCFIDRYIFISYTPYLSRMIVVKYFVIILLYRVLEHSFKCYMLVLECVFGE